MPFSYLLRQCDDYSDASEVACSRPQASERTHHSLGHPPHRSDVGLATPRVLTGVEGAVVTGSGTCPPASPVAGLEQVHRQTAQTASGRFIKTVRNLE